jgi:hypothetical protein
VRESSAASGDFATVAPDLTVKVRDDKPSQTVTSVVSSGGVYFDFDATMVLQGVNSSFASRPDFITAHEYGHAWTYRYAFLAQHDDWGPYLRFRWADAAGTVRLATDPRLDTTYSWSRNEIIAEDYRLLFGSTASVAQAPAHMNSAIPEPIDVPNLRAFFLDTWRRPAPV